MKKNGILVLLFLFAGCASAPVRQFTPVELVGQWRLLETRQNGIVRQYPSATLLYRFLQNRRIISRIRGRVFRGRWQLKGGRLFAWWPGQHRESHRIVSITGGRLQLLSRDGRLLSVFRKVGEGQ